MIDPIDDGCCDADGGDEGVCTSVIACVNASPIFEPAEHNFDFMALSVEIGVMWDIDFAV